MTDSTAAGHVLIGTSGWAYDSWRGDFYPDVLRQDDELAYLARRTTATEVNATFYRLQRPSTFRRWRDALPAGHRVAIKGSRYLTHMKQLRDPEAGLANLLASGVLALSDHLDVVLWQLPARMKYDEERIGRFLDALPRTMGAAARLAAEHEAPAPGEENAVLAVAHPRARLRHALEPRHRSFDTTEAADLLAAHDVAMVCSDSPGSWPAFDRDTASFRYVRLHGHSDLYASRYSDRSLDRWAERCGQWTDAGQDVHVYFDNDARGHAPHDALRLLDRLT